MSYYQNYSDTELIALLRNSDEAAFTEIFDRYNAVLYSHVRNKLKDEAGAGDIVQDIFIALWEKRGSIKEANLAGYLFTAAKNKVLNIISHEKIVARYEADFRHFYRLNGFTSAPADQLILQKETEAVIDAEIAALPPRMREVFILSRKEYLTHQEIADRLSISKQTVDDYIKRSLKVLRSKAGLIILIVYICSL